jgi:hypothetical protein
VRALVLGGYGAVGRLVVERLRAQGATAHAAGRDPRRADRVVDLRAPATLDAALEGVDVVVNAAGMEDPGLVARVTDRGIAFVDITATTAYVDAVEALRPAAPVVLSVGLAPGLTNLLAAAVHRDAPGPIDLAVVLGAGERHGKAGVAWTYDLLGRRFADPATAAPIRNFSRASRFRLPGGTSTRRLPRVDFSDQHTLTRDLGVPVRTHFGLDSRIATAALALLTRVPGGRHAPKGLHLPGGDEWIVLARADGRSRWATGHGQSHATAVVAVEAARAAGGAAAAVHHLHELLTLADLPTDSGIECHASALPALRALW